MLNVTFITTLSFYDKISVSVVIDSKMKDGHFEVTY